MKNLILFEQISAETTISEMCAREFEMLKNHAAYDYILFKYDIETNSIIPYKYGRPGSYYDQVQRRYLILSVDTHINIILQFVADLPTNEPCYAIKRISYTLEDGTTRDRILFVLYVPDASRLKLKMIFASQKYAFCKGLTGIAGEIAATDESEISLVGVSVE